MSSNIETEIIKASTIQILGEKCMNWLKKNRDKHERGTEILGEAYPDGTEVWKATISYSKSANSG